METEQKPYRFRIIAWAQFKKNKPAVVSLYVLAFMGAIALLAPLLATDRPLFVKYQGENFFPAFSLRQTMEIKTDSGVVEINPDVVDWKQMKLDAVVWAPIPYSPGKSDYANSNFVAPGDEQLFISNGRTVSMPARYWHLLGTGSRGDDLLSGLIHGARISMVIGFIATFIAALIGILVGLLAGFFGDNRLSVSRGRLASVLIGIFFAWFYAFQLRQTQLQLGLKNEDGGMLLQLLISALIFSSIIFLFLLAAKFLENFSWFKMKVSIAVDSLLSRLIEIVVSLPILLLIITIAAISKPSLSNVMVIIGLTNWTGIARLTRAEMLRVRNLEYMQAAEALGYTPWRSLLRHALPNAIAPAIVSVSFSVANAILLESALSFLGVGVPQTVTTWGSLISSGRENFHAWWMVVFPGICILITVLAFNLVGEGMRDALDPKLKK